MGNKVSSTNSVKPFEAKLNQFDLSIFKEERNECTSNHSKCQSIRRLLCSLKYYASLNIMESGADRDIFTHFINDVYGDALIPDYIHLINKHGMELQEINSSIISSKMFPECDIKKCQFTARHQEIDDYDSSNPLISDPKLNFFKQTMDGLHFYLMHCYHAGLRTIKNKIK